LFFLLFIAQKNGSFSVTLVAPNRITKMKHIDLKNIAMLECTISRINKAKPKTFQAWAEFIGNFPYIIFKEGAVGILDLFG